MHRLRKSHSRTPPSGSCEGQSAGDVVLARIYAGDLPVEKSITPCSGNKVHDDGDVGARCETHEVRGQPWKGLSPELAGVRKQKAAARPIFLIKR
mmetsp:Transcript_37920/g.61103  ORF Transcript_37920/g.61103 Transcript_37920/m.61103 type:complete len:95 (+) Transcript_37920:544-828(+)